jgi:site-specific recombinase XerD
MLRETKNVRVVQRFLGHARLDTTAIYTLVQDDELSAAVAAIPGPRRLRRVS